MITKLIEVRDYGTFVPMLAIQLGSRYPDPTDEERDRWLLGVSGFGRTFEEQRQYVVLAKINGGEPCACHIDPYGWGRSPRTFFVAHMYLLNRHREIGSLRPLHGGFHSLPLAPVICVEWILGERQNPKASEQIARRY